MPTLDSASAMRGTWDQLLEELAEKKAAFSLGGGQDRIDLQHSRSKLTARERLDLLFDPGSFVEYGMLADHNPLIPAMEGKLTPADGVITGIGEIDGRRACVAAYDFTVMAGSMGAIGEMKVARMRELAVRLRIPMIWLLDSAGARIQEAAGSQFARSGQLFREEVVMSGVVPLVSAMLGPCAAGTAYIPGLSDFVPMVKGTSSMALAGSHLVKAAVGEDKTDEEIGGSEVHTRYSGVADLEVPDDKTCIEVVREYLSFFPSHNREQPPTRQTDDPADRSCGKLLKIVPVNQRQAYDVRKVVEEIVDDHRVFEMKPAWARNVVTAFGRFGGMPAGIVANQPMMLGGALDVNGADKVARFVWLCDAFNIPLVFLMDVPGFLVGSAIERQGIIRHGAKMLFAVSEATVPKVTVVTRKGYGAGYFVMNGFAYEPEYIVAWPTAEISVMGPEGAVNIIFRKEVEAAAPEDQDRVRSERVKAVRDSISPYIAARWAGVDDVIDPRDTRKAIHRGLVLGRSKTVERPWRKHGVLPV
ncbi:MAG TPA: acyl-CoA carboxylase subunit beta [Actinomycetota bacterium]|nr:acyl-CoA carboxylase subunit beta [Actinomycetota bacterium]